MCMCVCVCVCVCVHMHVYASVCMHVGACTQYLLCMYVSR